MRLSARQYIFCLTLVFACGYAHAGAIVKRASGDDSSGGLSGLISSVDGFLKNIPIVGSSLSGLLQWVVKAFSLFEAGTNGAIGRLLGGTLPCTVSLDGTECKGLKNNGGFGKLLMSVLDDIPGLILPSFVKSFMKLGIQMFIDPTIDVLFGGVETES